MAVGPISNIHANKDPILKIEMAQVEFKRSEDGPPPKINKYDVTHPIVMSKLNAQEKKNLNENFCGNLAQKEDRNPDSGIVRMVLHTAANFATSAQDLFELFVLFGETVGSVPHAAVLQGLVKILPESDADELRALKTFFGQLLGVTIPEIKLTQQQVEVQVSSKNFDSNSSEMKSINIKGWLPSEILNRDISVFLLLLDGLIPNLLCYIYSRVRRMPLLNCKPDFLPNLQHIGLGGDNMMGTLRESMKRCSSCCGTPSHPFNLLALKMNADVVTAIPKLLFAGTPASERFGWDSGVYSGGILYSILEATFTLLDILSNTLGKGNWKDGFHMKVDDILTELGIARVEGVSPLELILKWVSPTKSSTGDGTHRGLECGELDSRNVQAALNARYGPLGADAARVAADIARKLTAAGITSSTAAARLSPQQWDQLGGAHRD
eukprot:CAMPEP_0177632240 /NCGR_PEP_ID=MMETSP0447-20121125/2182_1 /TAXON_ID=0 /ORGANISM="Stygamoeba regulata, Strain BSH-02190019" /LENGTH=437 /DNA_ID=CAMNT_0019133787 /DNA_START=335 /DNA_END=1647 /DNA_ORIENTATION=-